MDSAERIRMLLPMLNGNLAAAEFIDSIYNVLHLWDDLIDHDKPVTDMQVNDAFYAVLVEIPRNPFYRKYFDHLNPILVNAITNWHVANRMERKGDEYQKRIAYVLRSSYVDLLTQSAFLLGGVEHAAAVGFDNRLYAHKETLEGYLINLETEEQARNAHLE